MTIRRELSAGTMTSFDPGSTAPPSYSADELIAIEHAHGVRNYQPLPLVIARARGSWVQDLKGNRYLDMLSSFSTLNQGHRHPKIMAALKAQADRITLSSRAFHNDQLGPFLAKLTELTGFDVALPMNTESEAVDSAVRVMRNWACHHKGVPVEESEVITIQGSTHTWMTMSGRTRSENVPGFISIPFGDFSALENAITDKTAGFMVEPIQVEQGIMLPPIGYMKRVRDLCHERNVLLCVDEIRTGLGRTGRLFAFEHHDIQPDCVTVGRALGGGVFPVSAVLGRRDVVTGLDAREYPSTFGGNPLGSAVATASLDVVVDEQLAECADELGRWLMDQLREISSPHVVDVRGGGLLVGIEIRPESGRAHDFCEALMERGVLCTEAHPQVIRLAPPLTIDKDDLEWALVHLREVLQ